MQTKRALALLLSLLLLSGSAAIAQEAESIQQSEVACKPLKDFFKSKRKKAKEEAEKKKEEKDEKAKKYEDLIKEAEVDSGLMTTIKKKADLYFEIPEELFGKPLLISNRISQTSNTAEAVAGQMVTDPFMFRLARQGERIYMHLVRSDSMIDKGDPIYPSFQKNFKEPILTSFKIEAENGKNVVIDVTDFFLGGESNISPVSPRSDVAGRPMRSSSYIQSAKSFPQNVEVKSVLAYKQDTKPYTIEAHRSIALLPEEPMQMRLQDNRVGYFSSYRERYTTDLDKIEEFEIIHRWRLEPKDREAYFRGELVEPVKPIIFYVDSAFPEKWRGAVMAGVEDWNRAFEEAGFKHAIIAKPYPTKEEMPDFDPDDLRFSCIKYATTDIANAMGPSYVDPRSGEILCADVIWYHNVVSLLHHWRFTQTAATDARVRALTLPDEVMAEAMRYVASHEIGHTLGLMHNMGASYAFPVEKLRDPAFTQKYGTTPSIMDYARNNYIAQPGDFERGVKMTPPLLGVYDIYAINWGYRLIPDAKDYRDEKKTLNAWIEEKIEDPMYRFGAQQFFTMDPTDQTEDLGDDHIKAGNYGISNLKIIAKNYAKWLYNEGDRTDDLLLAHEELARQFFRHLNHVVPYIGGREYYENRQGDGKMPVTYFPKAKQQAALKWVVQQVREMDGWLFTDQMMQKYDNSGWFVNLILERKIPERIAEGLLEHYRLQGIIDGSKAEEPTGYTLKAYLDDYCTELLDPIYKGRTPNKSELGLMNAALYCLTSTLEGKSSSNIKMEIIKSLQEDATEEDKRVALEEQLFDEWLHQPLCMNHPEHIGQQGEQDFFRINILAKTPQPYELQALMMDKLTTLQRLLESRSRTYSDPMMRGFCKQWSNAIKELTEVRR